jgi:hypothetical protein
MIDAPPPRVGITKLDNLRVLSPLVADLSGFITVRETGRVFL